MHYRTFICVAGLIFVPGLVRASDMTFTSTIAATFQFDVLGGTPINPGGDSGWQNYEAVGALTFTLASSINDPSQTTVAFTGVSGTLTGVYPTSLVPFTISPDVAFLGGDLTNVVRDASGNVTSADVSNLSSNWDLIAYGGALTLFSTTGLPFDGTITSIPFSNGTVLSDYDQFNVYFDNGGTDVLVAYGRDRILTAVPEPSSAALVGMAVLALCSCAAVHRRGGANP
jgi:hypothetical protein